MNNTKENIELSIIIPMYNVEEYIDDCIESVCNIKGVTTEIIIIDDGSTDKSYEKAKIHTEKYANIFLYRQDNIGLSKTRNKGLTLANGGYILFLDRDDRLASEEVSKLYEAAIQNDVDMILGQTIFEYIDGNKQNPYDIIPADLENRVITGEESFIKTMSQNVYIPMVWCYLYKRDFLTIHNWQFVDIIFEDEIWTLETMVTAKRVLLTNIHFHYYRQRENSKVNSFSWKDRIINLLNVSNYLYGFSQTHKFDEAQSLKSWIIVKILQLYFSAFQIIPQIKDSRLTLPNDFLDEIEKLRENICEEAKLPFINYMDIINKRKKVYESYTRSVFFNTKVDVSKTIILIYNSEWSGTLPIHETLPIDISEIPEDITVTTDRKHFNVADAVIFHLPDLMSELEVDLDKPENQIWISWFLESEANYPFVNDKEFMSLFDYEMSYRQNADIVVSYYNYNHLDLLKKPVDINEKEKDVCMVISSPFNKSKRIEYLEELMSYLDIDSYGAVFNNSTLKNDTGRSCKLDLYSQYKFVIAFENSVSKDYVTEKFYDPLLVGSVPVYFGAPNINDFSPGNNSFINVHDFDSPKELALFIKKCCKEKDLYQKLFSWKEANINKNLMQKIAETKPSAYIAAFNKIRDKVIAYKKSSIHDFE